MGFLEFAADSPITVIFLAYAAATVIAQAITRGYRAVMVCVRGWPPAHLDADGDWKADNGDGDE